MFAYSRRLVNLTAIVDRNMIGNDGRIDASVDLEPLAEKWRSFGWRVFECNGHHPQQIEEKLMAARLETGVERSAPSVVIARTEKGHGLVQGLAGTGASHYIKGNSQELIGKFGTEIQVAP
jgi:transketolase